ncbi:MAG: glucosamine-6-phosphate deaminase [Firmicutes bacterium]|nr:glucosamine-6-phosphate deaminase [Bacillota bacterium]
MDLVIFKNYDELSQAAAEKVIAALRNNPRLVLGLATGSTPLGLYQRLVEAFRQGRVDFAQVTTFNLDEYYGLPASHEQSYHYYMWEHLFRHVNVPPENTFIPAGDPADVDAECRAYEEQIARAGGIDLQILGIGANGHIGFNEPGVDFSLPTHLVELSERTITANSRFFPSRAAVPRKALSMGIRTIMKAREILLLASGPDKAEAVRNTVEGPVTPEVPASVLQRHPRASIFVDEAAAALLSPALRRKVQGAGTVALG